MYVTYIICSIKKPDLVRWMTYIGLKRKQYLFLVLDSKTIIYVLCVSNCVQITQHWNEYFFFYDENV